MNGLLPTRIQQRGRKLLKAAAVFLVFALVLSACSAVDWLVGDGRGDWTLDIYEGYAIDRINSKEIVLTHKDNPDDLGGEIILPNYFVLAYQLHEPYICLEGIRTQGWSITEDELKQKVLSYYLIDAVSGERIGPFESWDDFAERCNALGFAPEETWIITYTAQGQLPETKVPE